MRSTPRHGVVKSPGIMDKVHIFKFGHKSEKAQELVEFALVLPLLILVLYGAVDLGRAFHAAITITNAAREGARAIALDREDLAGAKQAAVREALNSGITITLADVSLICKPDINNNNFCTALEPAQVTVTYDFHLLINPILSGSILTLQRTAEMLVQ